LRWIKNTGAAHGDTFTGIRFYNSAANTALHVRHVPLLNSILLGHARARKMKSYYFSPSEKAAAFPLSVQSEKP
jgi:hypothetical protein